MLVSRCFLFVKSGGCESCYEGIIVALSSSASRISSIYIYGVMTYGIPLQSKDRVRDERYFLIFRVIIKNRSAPGMGKRDGGGQRGRRYARRDDLDPYPSRDVVDRYCIDLVIHGYTHTH